MAGKTDREARMKPAAFDYISAETLDEALTALSEEGADARVLAGGQSLMAMLNMRLARPKLLVDIMRIGALDRIEEGRGEIVIGAGVRQAKLLGWDGLKEKLPLVALALPWTGHVQTRSRGTVCGSIAHADPSAELPLSLVALGGAVHLRSVKKRRRVAATDYITGMMSTARGDDEMIEAVSFPIASARGYGFREIARRRGDFAVVACAAVVDDKAIRFAVGGVADKPEARDWPRLDGSALDDALNAFAYQLDARDDVHATARYRRELVRRVGRAVIEEAARCHA
jgi:2-furoyl-CoA dehydrogenase FAD binding subunit